MESVHRAQKRDMEFLGTTYPIFDAIGDSSMGPDL
jgi:hypothetical protein